MCWDSSYAHGLAGAWPVMTLRDLHALECFKWQLSCEDVVDNLGKFFGNDCASDGRVRPPLQLGGEVFDLRIEHHRFDGSFCERILEILVAIFGTGSVRVFAS